MDQLTDLLSSAARRLRLRDGWRLAQRSLWLAVLATALIQMVGRLWPLAHLWAWSIAPLVVWLLGVPAFALLRPMPLLGVARRCDAELGLKERLATALLLERWRELWSAGAAGAATLPAFQPALVELQRQDAIAAARSIDPRRAFPLDWRRRPLLLAAALVAAAVVLAVLPNRMDAILAERAAVAEAAKEQAAQIEALRQEVEAMAELNPAEREELLRRLAELAEQLQANRGDREEALADLSRLEEALQPKVDPRVGSRQAALDALAARLQELAGQEATQKADQAAVEQALAALAEQAAGMDPAGRQDLARSLAQMAGRAAQAGETELAQALSEMAQAAQSGDAQSAAQSGRKAAEAMASAQADLAAQATAQLAAQQALAQVQGSRQAIAQAGQASAPGTTQGPGTGPSQGQGQAQGQGQPGGGGGTRAATLPPARRTGQAGRPVGQGQPGGTGALDSQVYVPWEHRPGSGEQVTLPGQDTGQGETETREQRDPLPGAQSQALVPYHQVYYDYLDAANEAVEQSYIPSGLKDYVRAYFSQLEP